MLELLVTKEAVCLDKAPHDPTAKVVACDSPAAAYQLVGKGVPISATDADRFGIKTEKADASHYTLRIDSHTIARTPEEKAYAATQPQPGLVNARAEQIRTAAALEVASLGAADAAKAAASADESKKADDLANKKVKAALVENKSAKKKAPRKAAAKKAAAKSAESTPATP